VHCPDCELTSNAQVRASFGSGDVVGTVTKHNSPHGLVLTWFDLKVNVTEPLDHCDDPDNIR
jgi:hypothetical protein